MFIPFFISIYCLRLKCVCSQTKGFSIKFEKTLNQVQLRATPFLEEELIELSWRRTYDFSFSCFDCNLRIYRLSSSLFVSISVRDSFFFSFSFFLLVAWIIQSKKYTSCCRTTGLHSRLYDAVGHSSIRYH